METQIFVISLQDAAERRRRIGASLDALGLSHVMLDAVDTRGCTDADRTRMLEDGIIHPSFVGSSGTIGCALSHQSIYRRMTEEGIPRALVLEDDAVLHPDCPKVLPFLDAEIRDDEVVLLHYRSASSKGPSCGIQLSTRHSTHLWGEFQLAYPMSRRLHSAAAYMLTAPAARRLLSTNLPIQYAADVWSRFHAMGAYQTIRVVYRYLVQVDETVSTRVPPGTRVTSLRQGLRYCAQRGIFPLHQVSEWRGRRRLDRRMTVRYTDEISPLAPPR